MFCWIPYEANSVAEEQLDQFPTKYRLFLGAIQFSGLQGAGALITHYETRKNYLAFIEEELSPEWYDPLSIWRSYPGAVQHLDLPFIGLLHQEEGGVGVDTDYK